MTCSSPHTDLACERRRADLSLPGVTQSGENCGRIRKETLTVTSPEGAASIGKPMGTYITFDFPPVTELTEEEENLLRHKIGSTLREGLLKATQKSRLQDLTLLVVGLGNRRLTADALGCLTAEKTAATFHVQAGLPELFRSLSAASVIVLIPGVLSQSGLEAADQVTALVRKCHPDAVLAIDALFARSVERLFRTVQIADSGIEPGGGIGNRRKPITQKNLGIPVFSLGIPTVTDTKTLMEDLLTDIETVAAEKLRHHLPEAFEGFISDGQCDLYTEKLSDLVAAALNEEIGVSL